MIVKGCGSVHVDRGSFQDLSEMVFAVSDTWEFSVSVLALALSVYFAESNTRLVLKPSPCLQVSNSIFRRCRNLGIMNCHSTSKVSHCTVEDVDQPTPFSKMGVVMEGVFMKNQFLFPPQNPT